MAACESMANAVPRPRLNRSLAMRGQISKRSSRRQELWCRRPDGVIKSKVGATLFQPSRVNPRAHFLIAPRKGRHDRPQRAEKIIRVGMIWGCLPSPSRLPCGSTARVHRDEERKPIQARLPNSSPPLHSPILHGSLLSSRGCFGHARNAIPMVRSRRQHAKNHE